MGIGVAIARAVDLGHTPWLPHLGGLILIATGIIIVVMAYKTRREVFGHEFLSCANVTSPWAVMVIFIGLLAASGIAVILVLT